MLKRQVWMADDDEFDYIVKNSQRLLGLSVQYENRQYIEEFTKHCNVMFIYGTYVLEGEADSKFSLGDIWSLFQESNNTLVFQANDKLYEGVELITKNIRSFTEQ